MIFQDKNIKSFLGVLIVLFLSTGVFAMTTPLLPSDWTIESLQSFQWTRLFSQPLNLDASGYEGVSFEVKGTPGEGSIYFVDFDKDDWAHSFSISSEWTQVRIPFTQFKACQAHSEPHFDISDLKTVRFDNYDLSAGPVDIRNFAFYGSKGVFGPTVCVDPVFDFYKPYPWSHWAKVIKNYGFTAIDLVIVWEKPDVREQAEIVSAFHNEGLKCRLRLYPTTDGEAYKVHPEWRQILLNGESKYDWRLYLCPNDPEFAAFMQNKINVICSEVEYDGIQLAEPWFEVWGGAYPSNPVKGAYACLCSDCREKFQSKFGIDPLHLFQEENPLYFEKPENKDIYEKWVKFRVDTINQFSNQCYDSAHNARPDIHIVHMYLSDCSVELDRGREYQAMDLDAIIKDIPSEMITIEDSWQEWTRPDLKPDFVTEYGKNYCQRIKNIRPGIHIQSHLDIGSRHDTKRNYAFMRAFSTYSRRAGFESPSYYEFSIQKFE
jgi:hypothetical protein